MARQYELECGHCGYLFTIEGDTRTRSVKCEVCGGVLTVAIAIPVASDPPPASPLPAPPPAPVFPPTFFRKRDRDSLPPHWRAEYLSLPWWNAHRAIKNTGLATDIARYCTFVYMCFTLVAIILLRPGQQEDLWQFHTRVRFLFLLPVAVHAVFQLSCALVLPLQVGQFAITSLVMLGLASLPLDWVASTQSIFALVVFVAMLLMWFGFWLWFLRRLGQNLGDVALIHLTQVFAWQCSARFVLAMALGIGAFLSIHERAGAFSWICLSGVGVIVLLVLWEYSKLLRATALAIARRAPIDPDR